MKMKRWILAAVLAVCATAWAADELSLSMGWTYNKSDRKRSLPPATETYDISGPGVLENVQSIGTTAEGLAIGEVTNAGFFYAHNLGTNNIHVGVTTGGLFVAFGKLGADEAGSFFLSTTGVWARATTAATLLEYVIADR